jgi:hypothetical protein
MIIDLQDCPVDSTTAETLDADVVCVWQADGRGNQHSVVLSMAQVERLYEALKPQREAA